MERQSFQNQCWAHLREFNENAAAEAVTNTIMHASALALGVSVGFFLSVSDDKKERSAGCDKNRPCYSELHSD